MADLSVTDPTKKLQQTGTSYLDSTQTTGSTSTVTDPIKLTSDKKVDQVGLNVETKGPSFETQTKAWFKDTKNNPALWDTFSEAEKQRRSDIALKGMIEAYNADQKQKGSNKRMTVAEQYSIYISKCKTEDEVIRLTRTVKSMDKNNQLSAFKSSYRYQNEDFRLLAEKILAIDYTKLDKNNITEAIKEIKANFHKDSIILAADNASDTDPTIHGEVTKTFMEKVENKNYSKEVNEEIDKNVHMSLAGQVGKFGVDKDGNPIKDKNGNDIQLLCFKQISKSPYTEALKIAAENISTLYKDNQKPAVQCIVETRNEEAIKAAASKINDLTCSKEDLQKIKDTLINSNYDSVKQEVAKQEANISTQPEVKSNNEGEIRSEQTQNFKGECSSTSNSITSSNRAESIEAITTKIEEMVKNNQDPSDLVKKLPSNMLLTMIRGGTSTAVLNAIFNSNPPMEVYAALSIEDVKKIGYERFDSQILFLNPIVQNYIVKERAKDGNLSEVNENKFGMFARLTYQQLSNKQKEEKNYV